MSGLNIGILTFHRCINYGSYWQAKCLVDGLKQKGHDPVILHHDARRVNIAEWKCALQPVLPAAVPQADIPLYKEKTRKFLQAIDALPLSPLFHLDSPGETGPYDIVIVGSDEVWNLLHPWYRHYPVFFGEGIQTGKLISYAASFGNYPAYWGLEETWSEKLKNFKEISVRDKNSQVLIKNAAGFEPPIVLDPCLQFTAQAEERDSKYWQKPYIAVYGHNFSASFISKAKAWSAHRGLPLISIGYRNDWADEQWLTADPHDFAHFIHKAEAVITNFFHGCVFSIRNAKPFVCEASPYRSNKINDLLEMTGGTMRLVNDTTPATVFNHCLNTGVEQDMQQRVQALRHLSDNYLDHALKIKQPNRYESFA